jgi:hypothetical protein
MCGSLGSKRWCEMRCASDPPRCPLVTPQCGNGGGNAWSRYGRFVDRCGRFVGSSCTSLRRSKCPPGGRCSGSSGVAVAAWPGTRRVVGGHRSSAGLWRQRWKKLAVDPARLRVAPSMSDQRRAAASWIAGYMATRTDAMRSAVALASAIEWCPGVSTPSPMATPTAPLDGYTWENCRALRPGLRP